MSNFPLLILLSSVFIFFSIIHPIAEAAAPRGTAWQVLKRAISHDLEGTEFASRFARPKPPLPVLARS
jgi:hypothetical protein